MENFMESLNKLKEVHEKEVLGEQLAGCKGVPRALTQMKARELYTC